MISIESLVIQVLMGIVYWSFVENVEYKISTKRYAEKNVIKKRVHKF